MIEQILAETYGIGWPYADDCTVLWAAARCGDPEGEIEVLNRKRVRRGAKPVYVPHGYTFPAPDVD